MVELSRRQFVTALFGSAAALATARLPEIESALGAEIPDVVEMPALCDYARREVRRFWFEISSGVTYKLSRQTPNAPPEMFHAGGAAPGGMVFYAALPGDEIILLPTHLMRVDLEPLRMYSDLPSQETEFFYEGVDHDGGGLERPFLERHVVSSSCVSGFGGGTAIFTKEWHSVEERREWLIRHLDEIPDHPDDEYD